MDSSRPTPITRALACDYISSTGSERLTPAGAAKFLSVSAWTLRHLEARGELPPARRSLARGDRYYDADALFDLWQRLRSRRDRRGSQAAA